MHFSMLKHSYKSFTHTHTADEKLKMGIVLKLFSESSNELKIYFRIPIPTGKTNHLPSRKDKIIIK